LQHRIKTCYLCHLWYRYTELQHCIKTCYLCHLWYRYKELQHHIKTHYLCHLCHSDTDTKYRNSSYTVSTLAICVTACLCVATVVCVCAPYPPTHEYMSENKINRDTEPPPPSSSNTPTPPDHQSAHTCSLPLIFPIHFKLSLPSEQARERERARTGEREGEVGKKGAGYGDWAQREVEVCVARVRV